MTKTYAIIPAAGRGLRMGKDRPKQFLELAGKPILWHTLKALAQVPFLSGIFLVVPRDFMSEAQILAESLAEGFPPGSPSPVRSRPPLTVVAGGAERQDSVFNGMQHLPADCEWVFIHDGVRPFASPALMERTWKAGLESEASIAALPATDTVKKVAQQRVLETLPREQIWLVQTPQVFRKSVLLEAYEQARARGWIGTDDASFLERIGIPVTVTLGERTNIKVTTPEDLDWAEWFLTKSLAAHDA